MEHDKSARIPPTPETTDPFSPRRGPTFLEPPKVEEVHRLEDSAAAYAIHLVGEAAHGRGAKDLVEGVAALLAEVHRDAGRRQPETAKSALAEASALLRAGVDDHASEGLGLDLRNVLGWLWSWLRDAPAKPRQADTPTVTPAAKRYQLQQDLQRWLALNLANHSGDAMRLSTTFRFAEQAGTSEPRHGEFGRRDRSCAGDGHVLGRVDLDTADNGTYFAIHLLTGGDVERERTSQIVTRILGAIGSAVVDAGIREAAAATDVAGDGAIGTALREVLFGPVLTAAVEAAPAKLRDALRGDAEALLFHPVPSTVHVSWHVDGGRWQPVWSVKVQGYYMGTKSGAGEIRSCRQPNGMPYTRQIGGAGRYTYQFRFRVA